MPDVTLTNAVLREIASFISGEIDLWDLDAWLNVRTLDLRPDDPAFPMSREVFLLFAEVTSGHGTEADARQRLQRTLATHDLEKTSD